ncbi:MAG: serine/threonine protein kinase [Planctomycetota bacterium]|nr:MAG: serine/threonine protein kinase [Planctomycetota bacterium]
MSYRIRWQSSEGEGAFPLRGGALHLLWANGVLDRVQKPPESGHGLTVDPPDLEGRVRLEGWGEMQFASGDRIFRKVRLPMGKAVQFQVEGHKGRLTAEGKAPTSDPLVGREFRGYRVLGRIGSGAVGVVYRALQISLDREVALKVLNPKAAQDPLAVASFKREAQAAGQFSHPNLVQVHDVDEVDGLNFYSMELVPEGTLEDRLKEGGPLPWREALEAVRDCALALAYADEHHILHRDVKPENLMVTATGHVKLADLGLASTRGMIDKEAAGGTPHFMAPEAISGEVDHRADLYSLGCTLYRLLTGNTPFSGASVRDILRAHRDQPAPTLKDADIAAPKEVEEIVAKLLAKDPDARPEHASFVVEEIDALLSQGSPTRRRVAVVAILLLAVLSWLGYQQFLAPKPEPKPEPEVREVMVRDPDAEKAKAERDRLEAELAFTKANNTVERQARLEALQAFRIEFPFSDWDQQAEQTIQAIQDEIAAEVQAAEQAEQAASRAWLQYRDPVQAFLNQGRLVAAMAALQPVPEGVNAAQAEGLRQQVESAADLRFKAIEDAHQQALGQQNWAEALQQRQQFAALLEDAEHPVPEAWQARYESLKGAGENAEAEARLAAYRAAQQEFLAGLRGPVERSLSRMNPAKAGEHYADAVATISHPALAEAAAREQVLFEAAARAGLALREHLNGDQEVSFVEPVTGKRADILEMQREGLLVEVQVRGTRTQRLDPWQTYYQPESFYGLLRAALPPEVADQDACALHLLLAEMSLAQEVNSWKDQLPTAAQAEAFALQAELWLQKLPRKWEQPPEWWERHRAAISELAKFAASLAENDDYSAYLRLQNFLTEFSLLQVWCSDGRGNWGLQP